MLKHYMQQHQITYIRLVPYWNVNIKDILKETGEAIIRLVPYWNVNPSTNCSIAFSLYKLD